MTPNEAVKALLDAGWSESRIAKEVDVSQPTIHRIKRGSQRRGISFETGQKILDLHARVVETAAKATAA